MPFPKVIDINRPKDDYGVVLTLVKADINAPISDDKFALEQPEGSTLQVLGAKPGYAAQRAARGRFLGVPKEDHALTFKLILENLRHRPLRTLLSVLLIAIPVTLILTLVGLSHGMLEDSARRTRGVGADILVRPPNTSVMSFSAAYMPQNLVKRLQQEPHVSSGGRSGDRAGFTASPRSPASIWRHSTKMSGGFHFIEGGPFKGPDDILIDDYYAKQKKVHVGDYINVLNKKWRVAGIFESGKLSHIVLPLEVLQDLQGNTGRVSQVYLKLDDPANTDAVIASLKKAAPRVPDLFHAGHPHADLGRESPGSQRVHQCDDGHRGRSSASPSCASRCIWRCCSARARSAF